MQPVTRREGSESGWNIISKMIPFFIFFQAFYSMNSRHRQFCTYFQTIGVQDQVSQKIPSPVPDKHAISSKQNVNDRKKLRKCEVKIKLMWLKIHATRASSLDKDA